MAAKARAVRVLDPVAIRRIRILTGWGEAALSAALGVAPHVLHRLEHDGDQRFIDLSFVEELSHCLGVPVTELLYRKTQTAAEHSNDSDAISDDDVERVGAVLTDQAEMVCIDTIASAFGWTLERTLVAIDELEVRLVAVGQGLAWHTDTHVCVAPARREEPTAEMLSKRSLTQVGINSDEARVLRNLTTSGPQHRFGNMNRKSLGRLASAGLVEIGTLDPADRRDGGRKAEGARLTDEARFNLVL